MKIGHRFKLGDRVRKHSGSWWEGRVVGFYSTEQTPMGYCVQLDTVPNGPVQIYPEGALLRDRCRECDGYNCDDGCAYPDAIEASGGEP